MSEATTHVKQSGTNDFLSKMNTSLDFDRHLSSQKPTARRGFSDSRDSMGMADSFMQDSFIGDNFGDSFSIDDCTPMPPYHEPRRGVRPNKSKTLDPVVDNDNEESHSSNMQAVPTA